MTFFTVKMTPMSSTEYAAVALDNIATNDAPVTASASKEAAIFPMKWNECIRIRSFVVGCDQYSLFFYYIIIFIYLYKYAFIPRYCSSMYAFIPQYC